MILQHNGLDDVPVKPAPGGPLSDHYDPRNRTVNLSQAVYEGRSVASVAIAAHEVGHAIQHQKAYGPFKVRSAMAPAAGFASSAWYFLLLIGIFAQISPASRPLAIVLFVARRALPARDAAGRVRRLAPREAAAERARARHGRRVEGSEPGAHLRSADVRRGRVGRASRSSSISSSAANSGGPRCGPCS